VQLYFIDPGKPTQNAYIESFNGRYREECLNQHWFTSIGEAREIIEEWRIDYNTERPHSSLKYQTPEEFAAARPFDKTQWAQPLELLGVCCRTGLDPTLRADFGVPAAGFCKLSALRRRRVRQDR
jgi:hypothetical protein